MIHGEAEWGQWDTHGTREDAQVLEPKLLDANLVAKMAKTERIDQLIVRLAKQSKNRCVTARGLKQNAAMATLVKDCYPKYLNERLGSLTTRGTFIKVAKGVYQIAA